MPPIANFQSSSGNWQWFVERCGQFSPIVGLEPTDPQSVLLDITGLAHLFGGETALAQAIVGDFTRLGRDIHLAVADTIGAAWAAARYGKGKAEGGRRKAEGGRQRANGELSTHPSSLILHPFSSPFPLPSSPFVIIPPG